MVNNPVIRNQQQATPPAQKSTGGRWMMYVAIIVIVFSTLLGLIAISPVGPAAGQLANQVLKLESNQTMWYITRAAGMVAYILLWFSTVWGLVLPTKILDKYVPRQYAYDFHQFISLLSLGFTALHVIVLMADKYAPFSLMQILIPFTSDYRPFWVGVGVIGLYLTIIATISFYVRNLIGMKAFRFLHALSLIAYLGVTVHSLFAGTDASLAPTLWIYWASFLVVLFLTAYWLILGRSKEKAAA